MTEEPIIAICIASYKRPHLLQNTITAITNLTLPEKYRVVTIVVDNDSKGSARPIIDARRPSEKTTLYYFIEPARGLASVRNRLLEEAIKIDANLIAFIDDDEFPHPAWLINSLQTLHQYKVDIVSGPVIATDETAPSAMPRIKVKHKHATGFVPKYVGTNNVLFKRDLLSHDDLRFDPYYNFIGSEDHDFFYRAIKKGFSHIWCADAIIYETIPLKRKTKQHLFYRHFTSGIANVLFYKRTRKHSLLSSWAHFIIKLSGKIINSLLFMLAYLFTFNKNYLVKSIANIASAMGYLSGLLNIVVGRYHYPD